MRRCLSLLVLVVAALSCASPQPAADPADVRGPKVIKRVNPVYPEQLRAERVQGAVVITGIIPKEGGSLRDARVLRSDDPRLNQFALDAVASWIWSPAFQNGEAVDAEFTTTVRFSLDR